MELNKALNVRVGDRLVYLPSNSSFPVYSSLAKGYLDLLEPGMSVLVSKIYGLDNSRNYIDSVESLGNSLYGLDNISKVEFVLYNSKNSIDSSLFQIPTLNYSDGCLDFSSGLVRDINPLDVFVNKNISDSKFRDYILFLEYNLKQIKNLSDSALKNNFESLKYVLYDKFDSKYLEISDIHNMNEILNIPDYSKKSRDATMKYYENTLDFITMALSFLQVENMEDFTYADFIFNLENSSISLNNMKRILANIPVLKKEFESAIKKSYLGIFKK